VTCPFSCFSPTILNFVRPTKTLPLLQHYFI
jgi:hypothetical protein